MPEYIDPAELDTMEDSIGDTHRLSYVIDTDSRDGIYVIIGDKVGIAYDSTLEHSDMVKDMLNSDKYLERWELVEQYKNISFGSLMGSCAFIEVCEGFSEQSIIGILKENGINKVYDYDYPNDEATRLASKRK